MDWASKVDALSVQVIGPNLTSFYNELSEASPDSYPQAPTATFERRVPAWIDPARYVYSCQLLGGFFSYKHPRVQCLIQTLNQKSDWKRLALAMLDNSGKFADQSASNAIFGDPIEVHQAIDGTFMHSHGYGGRHRIVALVALNAPAIPVTLITNDV